ncbi:MAG: sigma-54-dependent transcriptional regulator [Pirellulaceae bacterium]
MPTVLVVDDDRTVLRLVEKAMREKEISVLTATNAADGLAAVQAHRPDMLLLDIQLPDTLGLEIAQQVRDIDPLLPIAYITVSDASDLAIEAMKLGAYDFLLKPLDVGYLQEVVGRALETRRLMQVPVDVETSVEGEKEEQHDALVGRSPKMLEVYKEIGRVAAQDVTVLIYGESGTGKELVARAIFQHSRRKGKPFLAVNCAALTETLLESELFGHEKGSFTGADRRRIGKFEQCNGGTIMLDEVGDMSPSVQSKVLRLLQEQRFERVGGLDTVETDVRIIAATNRGLEQMVEDGRFRLDLFHRLNDYRINLPPLRERGDDIELLVEHFLTRFSRSLRKQVQGVSPEVLKRLKEYAWPGNVRELQTVLKKSVLRAVGPVLAPEFLPDIVRAPEAVGEDRSSSDGLPPHDLKDFLDEREQVRALNLYAATLEMMERYLITRVLRQVEGNQSRASQQLGITRGSLRHKIRELGISIERVVQTGVEGRPERLRKMPDERDSIREDPAEAGSFTH